MVNYCTKCGAHLDDSGVCPNCGAVYTVDITQESQSIAENDENISPTLQEQFQPVDLSGYFDAPQPEFESNAEHLQQNYAQNAEYPQQKANIKFTMPLLITDCLDCIKDFFTKEPMISVEKVINGRKYLWTILAGLNVLAASLCVAGITGNGFNQLIEKLFGSYAFMMSIVEEYGFGQMMLLFFVSLISFAVMFFASSACEYVFLLSVQKKTAFGDVLQITSISYFPMTIACAAAFVFSFFLLPMSAVLLIAGFIASFMLLNESAKKLAGDVPFWRAVLNNIAHVVIAMVIISIALSIAL